MIYFLHHFDRVNQGDVLSGPYHYFDFPECRRISWDNDILKPSEIALTKSDAVVIGGGIYFTPNKPRLTKLVKSAGLFIGWGLGLDERAEPEEFIKQCDLLGTRERKSSLIDNTKVFYVPCASCMHEVFDRVLEKMAGSATASEVGKVALHVNGGFNCKELLRALSVKDLPTTRTVDPFEKIIANLAGADCVVTNSYHGAYWGALLGKRVVCIKTGVPKWEGLSDDIVFAEMNGLDAAIASARPVSPEYLKESRALNQQFHARVVAMMQDRKIA